MSDMPWDSILNLGGTLATNNSNLKAVRETNAANAALWREQSAYNAPIEQMKRLETAGLNPNLAYGQVAESRASNPPAMQAPEFEAPKFNIAENLAHFQQVKNEQALNSKILADTETAKANAIRAAADADYAAYETNSLKKSGTLKGDTGLVKNFTRGASALGDYVGGVVKKMEQSNKDRYNRMYLLKYGGLPERAHGAITLPTVSGDSFDGGQ